MECGEIFLGEVANRGFNSDWHCTQLGAAGPVRWGGAGDRYRRRDAYGCGSRTLLWAEFAMGPGEPASSVALRDMMSTDDVYTDDIRHHFRPRAYHHHQLFR